MESYKATRTPIEVAVELRRQDLLNMGEVYAATEKKDKVQG